MDELVSNIHTDQHLTLNSPLQSVQLSFLTTHLAPSPVLTHLLLNQTSISQYC